MSSTNSRDTAAAVAVAEALQHDPFYAAITRQFLADDVRKREVLARYVECSMIEGRQVGRVVVLPDPSVGAAVWLLPVGEENSRIAQAAKAAKIASFREILGDAGLETYRRIIEFMEPRAMAAISEQAWYLSIVGVAPRAQGQGIGARLLEPTLTEADRAGVDCYLETFDTRNPRFYGKLGFSAVSTHLEPVTGVPYAIMCRRPMRPGSSATVCRAGAPESPQAPAGTGLPVRAPV